MKTPTLITKTMTAAFGAALLSAGILTSPAVGTGLAGHYSEPSTLTRLSSQPVTRLLQSSGNLFWTVNWFDQVDGYWVGCVHRTSKSAGPGQDLTVMCTSSPAGTELKLGALTYAQVDGTWYGYVVVNYPSRGTSQIIRFPLAGGTAVALASNLRYIGERDLVNDGGTLFWCNGVGVLGMPIGGGTVKTLIAGSDLSRIGLDQSRLYYSTSHFIASIPKTGATQPLLEVDAATHITSMYIRKATSTVIYYGESSGAVRSHQVKTSLTTTYQAAGTYLDNVSVSFDGSRVLWIDYNTAAGSYREMEWLSGATYVIATGSTRTVDVQGDAAMTFWGSDIGLM